MVESLTTFANNHLQASQEAQRRGDFNAMLNAAERAAEADPRSLDVSFRLLECLLYCGKADQVLARLIELEASAQADAAVMCKIAEFYTHCSDHESALRCCRQAVKLQPRNPQYRFALSAAEIANGDLDAAEKHLTDVIALNPGDYDAYSNRATLKTQSVDDNHIAQIEGLLASGTVTPAGEVPLRYALAKEYEDLGEYARSFDNLKRGADKRRSLMNYRVEGDVAVMQRLQSVFNADFVKRNAAGCDEPGPIFVLGLPRSGTTLIDRILSSHSSIDSLGEINNVAYSLMHTIGRAADKRRLVELSATVDFLELGQRYVDSIRNYGKAGCFLIDKTPLNFLYIGLICLALPNARIVHVHRNPADSCYGMYRTLFRAGYPFSYDFDDLTKYYIAYRGLMSHWGDVVGSRFFDVSYEALVEGQESVSRALLDYCQLDWQPECLDFHNNPAAVSTASSAQVRQPVYRDALQRWRRYEEQLTPLLDALRQEGIDVDTS